MAESENIEVDGVIAKKLPNSQFVVQLTDEGFEDHQVHCSIAGKMRVNYIRIVEGDRVKIELTPYDLEKGRITYRYR